MYWQKAFDKVNWNKSIELVMTIGVDWRNRKLIRNLYMKHKVKHRLNQEVINGERSAPRMLVKEILEDIGNITERKEESDRV